MSIKSVVARITKGILYIILLLALLEIISFLNIYLSMVFIILVIIALIMIDAFRNRMLFVMSLRNLFRRKSTAVLVVTGLMVGTAIISSSFIVGDTLENLIVKDITDSYGSVDYALSAVNGTRPNYLNDSVMENITLFVSNQTDVELTGKALTFTAGVLNMNNNLISSSITVMGIYNNTIKDFDGMISDNGEKVTSAPDNGYVYINKKLAKDIDAKKNTNITIFYGNNNSVSETVKYVISTENFGGYLSDQNVVYMNINESRVISNLSGKENLILVKFNKGTNNIDVFRENITSMEENSTYKFHNSDKLKDISNGEDRMSMFTTLFFVFGSFAVISGVVLIINIFTMLAEERKNEMGMLRAIGLKRKEMVKTFLYEGVIYAAISSAVGVLFGLVISIGIIYFLQYALFGGNLISSFYFKPFSLSLSYGIGFFITVVTVYISTKRISRLNIVRAIRNIPEPPISRDDITMFRMGLIFVFLGFLSMLSGIYLKNIEPALGGLSVITMSSGFITRRWIGDRAAWNVAGILTIIQWMPKVDIFPYTGGLEIFILSGLFMVSSALLLVTFNSEMIIYFFTKIIRTTGKYKAVIQTAISYPLKAKMKTALSIFIFALVIFTVTVLSVINAEVSDEITNMMQDTTGGYDILAQSNPQTPPGDIWDKINTSGKYVLKENITDVISLTVSNVKMNYTYYNPLLHRNMSDEKRKQLIVFGNDFMDRMEYKLSEWNKTVYGTEEDVWNAVKNNKSLVILDSSMAAEESSSMAPGSASSYSIAFGGFVTGDNFTIIADNNATRNVTVVGFTSQMMLGGIFMYKGNAGNLSVFKQPNLFAIKLKSGLDSVQQGNLIEREFLPYGMMTISVEAIAKQITSAIESVFTLFRAFLSLGLIIGIAGLGIITIRSIHERRFEIGIMRAIGYTKKMIVNNFAIESSFISMLGILIGTILGLIVGYSVWDSGFREEGASFIIPWFPILFVDLLAFLFTLVSIYPAARGASKVSPAEVLRFD